MSKASRIALTILSVVFIAFPSFADGGIEAIGGAVEDLALFVGKLIGVVASIIFLVLSLVFYIQKKRNNLAVLVYGAFGLIVLMFSVISSDFLHKYDSNHYYYYYYYSAQEADRVTTYNMIFNCIGFLIFSGIIWFIVYHIKSLKKQQSIY
jgi:multisubunit Na+/H+ antiporter MnhB subunit